MGCNQVFDRVLLGQPGRRVGRVTPGHGLFYFFINPARFQSQTGRVADRPAGSGWVSKLCFKHWVPSWLLFDEGPLSAESRDSRGLVSFFCLVAFL
jgi:hypothetical protein